ncbi:RHS repeat protein [Leeia aquatica]|uniref:RHS repeat protein n=1 Tax=Leeia aquatica TaxID=2725557 RepID=A0A847S7L3_9NEIS|nr:RHS repeat protein [Leeia aquatica]NLR75753.1 RHS repeat protein [Leeia aquatica]
MARIPTPTPFKMTSNTMTPSFRPALLGLLIGLTVLQPLQAAVLQTRSFQYDAMGRLTQAIDANGKITQFAYDANGNQTLVTDANNNSTRYSYDALNRLSTITDANNGVTTLGYNLADQLTSVTDPRTLKTQYQYNGLGDLLKQISPDTGSTSYRYAADGQRSGQTDARNKATDDTLDAAGRVTQRNQAGVITQYSYGAANDPDPTRIGRLVQYTDPSGTTQLGYNLRGQLTRKSISYTTVGSVTATRVLQYQYDDKGRLSGITYPSGLQIGYHYTVDQLDSIQLNGQDLIKQIQWQGPSQRLSSWTWANGQPSQWQYDSNGRISLIKHGDRYSKSYQYDDAGRLLQQNDSLTPVLGQSYQYDKLDRLTQTTRNTTTEQYQYDADSNRSSKTVGSASTAYSYPATSNRLSSAGTTAFTYDAAGNITKGRYSYSYDNGGRLSTVKNGSASLTSYLYNTLGQRVIQSSNSKPIHYVYDEAGHRIGSYADPATQQISDETVWLGDLPIATVRQDNGQAKAWYLHSDHLATPRQVVDPAGNSIVWQWEGEAFGATPPDEDPDHDGKKFIQNLRFPGQWQDRVSGLVYNYYRDYDPELGRYIQSDPIGLAGGINTYGYVEGNPLDSIDPLGLSRYRAASGGARFNPNNIIARQLEAQIRARDPNFSNTQFESPNSQGATAGEIARLQAILRRLNSPKSATACSEGDPPVIRSSGKYNTPRSTLPRGPGGEFLPLPDATGAHSTIGPRIGSDGKPYTQGATFDSNGKFLGRTDVTDHQSPHRPGHTNPHHHPASPTNPGHIDPKAGPVPGPLPFP